jgi:hypothetical protein
VYGLIWRILPGPGFLKFLLFMGLVAAAAYGLWFYAFPWADPHLPFNDVTVGDAEGDGGDGGDGPAEGGGVPGSDAEGADEDIVGVDVPIGEEDEESAE